MVRITGKNRTCLELDSMAIFQPASRGALVWPKPIPVAKPPSHHQTPPRSARNGVSLACGIERRMGAISFRMRTSGGGSPAASQTPRKRSDWRIWPNSMTTRPRGTASSWWRNTESWCGRRSPCRSGSDYEAAAVAPATCWKGPRRGNVRDRRWGANSARGRRLDRRDSPVHQAGALDIIGV